MSTVNEHNAAEIGACPVLPVPVKRVAFIMTACTIADCPIESVCVSRKKDDMPEVVCGYYLGSHTYGSGSQVVCGLGGGL